MQILIRPCKYNSNHSLLSSSLPLNSFDSLHKNLIKTRSLTFPFSLSKSFKALRTNHLRLCSRNDVIDGSEDNAELGLLDKPFPVPRDESQEDETSSELVNDDEKIVNETKLDEEEALAPFLKFFNNPNNDEPQREREREFGESEVEEERRLQKRVNVEYYEPKPGDFAVGVVVSGNENKLDVNVGADFLGTMLTKEVLPLYSKEIEFLVCDPNSDSAEDFYAPGKIGVVSCDKSERQGPVSGRPVVEPGTVLFAEVLGRTLSGRPLLSSRRLFRRIAWHRLRQIQQLNEPVEVRITEWNTGGLLARLEGLRAFVPKAELMKKIYNFSELKEKVGSRMRVLITRINEEKNDLILSEKEAWQMTNLRDGALLEGTVRKIFPYGAQIRIGETNRSGLLHISNMSKGKITTVSEVLAIGEKVKVLVVNSMFPEKISLSIGDLESEPGLFITDKERVFLEAEMMAKKYRAKLPGNMTTERSKSPITNAIIFENEEKMYANWKWFKFVRDDYQTDDL